MTTTFSKAQKERLREVLEEHKTDPKYAGILAEAKKLGYRLAEVWEREMFDNKDLFCWRRTIWVKEEQENAAHREAGEVRAPGARVEEAPSEG